MRRTLMLAAVCLTLALPWAAHAQILVEPIPIPLAPHEPPPSGGPPCDRSQEGIPCHDVADCGDETYTCELTGPIHGGGKRPSEMPEPSGEPVGICVKRPDECMTQSTPPPDIQFPPGVEDPMPGVPPEWLELFDRLQAR